MLTYVTCGESHGEYLTAILEGMPSGLRVDDSALNRMVARRQQGYGRGGRQRIEKDRVRLTGGVVKGLTTGAPVGFLLANKDAIIDKLPDLTRPRPGHADLAGALKYDQGIRPVLERASARETVMRVAAGSLCRTFLNDFGMDVESHVIQIGSVKISETKGLTVSGIRKQIRDSSVNCICPETAQKMIDLIEQARSKGDTLGGRYEIRATGVPPGLGSYVHFERKLDGRLAQHLMSMQSVKAVEIGDGVALGALFGSGAHDEIFFDKKRGYYRRTDHAGGIEGGMTNGSDVVVRVTMKPIATLARPLMSVNMTTKKPEEANFERSDTCAVPAGSVIGTAIASFVFADAFLEKFGGDSVAEVRRNYDAYLKRIKK